MILIYADFVVTGTFDHVMQPSQKRLSPIRPLISLLPLHLRTFADNRSLWQFEKQSLLKPELLTILHLMYKAGRSKHKAVVFALNRLLFIAAESRGIIPWLPHFHQYLSESATGCTTLPNDSLHRQNKAVARKYPSARAIQFLNRKDSPRNERSTTIHRYQVSDFHASINVFFLPNNSNHKRVDLSYTVMHWPPIFQALPPQYTFSEHMRS